MPSAAVSRWNIGAICLCTLLAFGGFTSTARAQYRFDSWTADTGLPQNIIRGIHQTADGYLWFATLDGLARFDGVRFTIFNKSNSPGIQSNRFTGIYEDPGGALWLGTENSGLTRYYRGEFSTYTTQHGLPSNVIRGVFIDHDGNAWALSGEKLVRWTGREFQPASAQTFAIDTHCGQTILDGNHRGGFWCVNDSGLSLFVDGQLTNVTRENGLPRLNVSAVAVDPHGALWVATEDDGLVRIEGGRVTRVWTVDNGLPGNHAWFVTGQGIKAFSRDPKGALWITDLETGRNNLLTRTPPPPLVDRGDYRLYEDREGNIWIGTEGDGLYRARQQSITSYSKEDGLVGRNIYPLYEDDAGAVWIGTYGNGLSRFKDGVFTNYTVRNGLSSDDVTALHEDRSGNLWVGTIGGNLQILSKGAFKSALDMSRSFNASTIVYAIYQDREKTLWFGTNEGLVRYRDGVATSLTRRDGLAGDDIKVIIEGASGCIWIGAYGGVTCIKGGTLTPYTELEGLPSNSVRALYEDADGVLWIGTYDGGLGRFKNGTFTRYTTREGLFNDGVFQILEDARGNLWMSSNRGIHRVKKQELNDFADGKIRAITSIGYGKSDGMLNAECNGGRSPAGIRSRDGKLWFPTQDGVAVIDPEAVLTNPHAPPVRIETFLLDRAPMPLNEEVRIQPGKENFEIEYTAPSFVNSESIRFRYRLEGLDHDWIDAGTRRTAYYSHVPAGAYTFQVIAANRDGVWNAQGDSLRIRMLPPFYRAWWFLALAAISVTGLAVLAYRSRIAQLKREQLQQQAFSRQLIESQERERQRIAAELHDSLGQNLLVIKNRAQFGKLSQAYGMASSQFQEISDAAAQTLEEVRLISYNLRPSHLDQLGLRTSIEAMLGKLSESCAIRFTSDIDGLDGSFSADDAITVYRIVQESLNNVIKHSHATEACVAVKRHDRNVTLTVQDNGRGFIPGATRSAPGSGFGLVGLAERVRMLGGTHAVDSVPGRGTTVTVRLDVRERTQESANAS